MTMVKMKGQDFAKAVVETRTLEKQLLPRDILLRLLNDTQGQEVAGILKENGYRGIPPEGIHGGNFDGVLRMAMESFGEEIHEISPYKEFLDLIS